MMTQQQDKENQTDFYDSILLLSLNETAFSKGLIDETIKGKIRNEIQNSICKWRQSIVS